MNELMHISLEIMGNALLAKRRKCAAATRELRVYRASQPAPGPPQIVKATGFKLLDVKILPRQVEPIWDLDLRSNRAGALFSIDVVKRSAFSFSMVTCFES